MNLTLTLLTVLLVAPQDTTSLPAEIVVAGRVIDAGDGAALEGSTVMLERAAAAGDTAYALVGNVVTGPEGDYRFEGVALGQYRLRVARIGYYPNAIELDLRRREAVRVSLALNVQPISLEPIGTSVPAAESFGLFQSREQDIEMGRLGAVHRRQQEFLGTDVRTMTYSDVIEASTLGEPDVFRAVQRLPGVTARDDFAAEPLVRGAGFDHTRVTFDGLPLFSPVSGFGVLSAIGPEVLGSVYFQPGVRSAEVGEGAASVLSLTTRPAGSHEVRGFGELSLASARLAVDRRVGDRVGVMVGARRSYLDALVGLARELNDDPELVMPYAFSNVAARVDYQIDERRALEASVLWAYDRLTGDIPDVTRGNRAEWGNTAGRITLTAPIAGLASRHTLGATAYRASVVDAPPDTNLSYSAPAFPETDSRVTHLTLAGVFERDGASMQDRTWRFGYRLVHQSVGYDGPVPRRPPLTQNRLSQTVGWTDDLAYAALWGERRVRLTSKVTVEPGLRIEAGPSVGNGGAVRLAPRLMARYAPTPRLSLTLGAGRSYQYSQTLAASGLIVADGIESTRMWLAANDTIPALRSDMAQAGVEWWMSATWLAGVNGYVRRTTGMVVQDPAPGGVPVIPPERHYVRGDLTARGIEVSLRRLAGRLTSTLSYAYGASTVDAGGFQYASDADRRHALSASAMVRAGRPWRFAATYRRASGTPHTEFVRQWDPCNPTCDYYDDAAFGAPNGVRSPTYSSLDVMMNWEHAFSAWTFGFFLQVSNVLNHDNPSAYQYTDVDCLNGTYVPAGGPKWGCREFQQGMPLVPVLGFRVAF